MPEDLSLVLCPPLRKLLWFRTRGKLRRTLRRILTPRRAALTAITLVIVALWFGHAVLAIALRQPTDPALFRAVAPLAMLAILLVKLVSVCIDRHRAGAGYRPEEIHRLCAGPFPLHQVRLYKVAGNTISIAIAALLASVLLWTEVSLWLAAFLGIFLAMMFTYLVHSIIAVLAAGVGEATYRRGRVAACAATATPLVIMVVKNAVVPLGSARSLASVWRALLTDLFELSQSPPGRILFAPFNVFTELISARHVFPDLVGWAVLGALVIQVTVIALLRLESGLDMRANSDERLRYSQLKAFADGSTEQRVFRGRQLAVRTPWLGGAGPVIWRQTRALGRVRGGVLLLLLPMALLSGVAICLSCNRDEGLVGPVCAVAVLTALCLPGLLPFDFRGDVDNMCALKTLPLRPQIIVFGQLLVPVVLIALFQFLALLPLVVRGWSWTLALPIGVLLLVPVNFIIVGLENLVFLLYPYRLAEFDMQATVRRMVMLMTKFLALGIAGAVVIVSGLGLFVVRLGVQRLDGLDPWVLTLYQPLLYVVQLAALGALAAGVLKATTWAYCRYDLCEDAPA